MGTRECLLLRDYTLISLEIVSDPEDSSPVAGKDVYQRIPDIQSLSYYISGFVKYVLSIYL